MAKYIAHASLDERGKIKGGAAGDNTGKEVCVRTWYNKPWNCVLRIKNEKVRKQFANNMIDLAKANYAGYDQNQRNTLLTQAKKVDFDFTKIKTKCECDCSSAVTICLLGAIYKVLGKEAYDKAYKVLVVDGNCATTSTLRSRLNKLDMITVYTSSTYIAGTSKAVFGDIYLKEGKHVACYVDDGNKVTTSTSKTPAKNNNNNCLEKGDKGDAVEEVQNMLIKCGYSCGKYGADADFGNDTLKAVKAFQKDYKLTVDGVVGEKTMAKLKEVYKKKTEKKTTSTVKVDSAKYFNDKYAKTYKTTSDLNMRSGAGSTKKKILTIPKGKEVKCYGYYSKSLGTVWLLVQYNGQTGFCSIKYLK